MMWLQIAIGIVVAFTFIVMSWWIGDQITGAIAQWKHRRWMAARRADYTRKNA